MSVKRLKGYLLAVLCLVILVAAAFLLLNNIGGAWSMQVFWRPVTLRPAAWLLLAAAGGVVVYWTLRRLLPAAIANLRQAAALKRAEQSPEQPKKPLKDQTP
jgi:hypothetical protein